MGVVALHRHDALYLALRVEYHLRFYGLEINCAALGTRFRQYLVQLGQVGQLRYQRAMLRGGRALRILQYLRHYRIGEPRVRPHD